MIYCPYCKEPIDSHMEWHIHLLSHGGEDLLVDKILSTRGKRRIENHALDEKRKQRPCPNHT